MLLLCAKKYLISLRYFLISKKKYSVKVKLCLSNFQWILFSLKKSASLIRVYSIHRCFPMSLEVLSAVTMISFLSLVLDFKILRERWLWRIGCRGGKSRIISFPSSKFIFDIISTIVSVFLICIIGVSFQLFLYKLCIIYKLILIFFNFKL